MWLMLVIGRCSFDPGPPYPDYPEEDGTSTTTGDDLPTGLDPSTSGDELTAALTDGGSSSGTGSALCSNGELDPPEEECEDCNNSPGDGCYDCRFDPAECNGISVDPGEPCDGGPDCDACLVVSHSRCASATPVDYDSLTKLNEILGYGIPFGDLDADFVSQVCTGATTAKKVNAYHYRTGAFPEGLAAFFTATNPLNISAYVWAYRGCGSTPLSCVFESDPMINTGIAPPGTELFLGLATDNDISLTYDVTFVPFRALATFDQGAEGWALDGGWMFESGNNGYLIATADGLSMAPKTTFSPPVHIAGLGVEIHAMLNYTLVGRATNATLRYAFDGGPMTEWGELPQGVEKTTDVAIPRPHGTQNIVIEITVKNIAQQPESMLLYRFLVVSR